MADQLQTPHGAQDRSPEASHQQTPATAGEFRSGHLQETEPVGALLPGAATPRGPLPFRTYDQIFFGVACAIALACMAIYCVRTSHWGADPIELEGQPPHALDYKIDLNSSTWVEWSQLPGIGPVLARRIIEEREQNGPFREIDDLNRVRGIGPKKINAIRPFIQTEARNDSQGTESDQPRQVDSANTP